MLHAHCKGCGRRKVARTRIALCLACYRLAQGALAAQRAIDGYTLDETQQRVVAILQEG